MKTLLVIFLFLAVSCGGPSRTTFAMFPGAPPAFEASKSDPHAVELAQAVFVAAGGPDHWDHAKQIRWTQSVLKDGKIAAEGEQAWDRWNGRHYGRIFHRGEKEKDIIAIHDLYGDYKMAFEEAHNGEHELAENDEREQTVKVADRFWRDESSVLCLAFLLREPGAMLKDKGQVHDPASDKNYEELVLTFSPADATRAGVAFHAYVDPETKSIDRVDVEDLANAGRRSYALKDWTTVDGMKFATTRENLGDKTEVIKLKDIKVGDPDDTLYIAPVT